MALFLTTKKLSDYFGVPLQPIHLWKATCLSPYSKFACVCFTLLPLSNAVFNLSHSIQHIPILTQVSSLCLRAKVSMLYLPFATPSLIYVNMSLPRTQDSLFFWPISKCLTYSLYKISHLIP